MRTFIVLTIAGTVLCPVSEIRAQYHPPAFEWVKRIEATNCYGWSVGLDPIGNPVLVGEAASVVGLGSTNIPFNDPNSTTGILIRADEAGAFTGGIGLTGPGQAQVIQVKSAGDNIVISGSVWQNSTKDFGGTTLPQTNSQNGFIASYSAGNALNWVLPVDMELHEHSVFFGLDNTSDGGLVAAGVFTGTAAVIGGTTLTNFSRFEDIMVVRVNGQGGVDWGKTFGGPNDDFAYAVATDRDDDIIISGTFNSPSIAFGSTLLSKKGQYADGFVAKLDKDGEPIWAASSTSAGWTMFISITVDPDSNEIVVSGTKNFPGSEMAMILQKYSSTGELLWERDAAETDFARAEAVTIDSDGNIFVCGGSSMGGTVWKLNSKGEVLWRKYAANGSLGGQVFQSVVVAPDNSLFLSAYFTSATIELDGHSIPRLGEAPYSPTTVLAKLAADPPTLRHQMNAERLVLSWPTNQPGFLLEANSLSLQPETWQSVNTGELDGRNVSTNPLDGDAKVFRLRKNPEP